MDKYYEDQLRYPLDGDLSNGTTGARSTIILLSVNAELRCCHKIKVAQQKKSDLKNN